jgi:hypothetical protein
LEGLHLIHELLCAVTSQCCVPGIENVTHGKGHHPIDMKESNHTYTVRSSQ